MPAKHLGTPGCHAAGLLQKLAGLMVKQLILILRVEVVPLRSLLRLLLQLEMEGTGQAGPRLLR